MRNSGFLQTTVLTLIFMGAGLAASAQQGKWLETDSAAAVAGRIEADFPLDLEQARDALNQRYGLHLTVDSVLDYGRHHYVELLDVDGRKRMHKKSVRNLALLHPALNGNNPPRGAQASPQRIAYVDTILAAYDNSNGAYGAGHAIKYKFEIDVPYSDAIAGDTLHVWMPLPRQSQRQRNIKIISASPADYTLSAAIAPTDEANVHNSIYFSAPVKPDRSANHFEYILEFETFGQYFSPEEIKANIMPYDTTTDLYRRYTAVEPPHIIHTDLARQIVGAETDPYRCSELVYDYIIERYPWAGAREYSTIPCIPQYVIDEGHGDCGQVALLYISLMRSLGIPARWESGWMLHPGEVNLHDWAEVYFEGVGWVPVDVSFGRYTAAKDPRARKFYSTGMDAWRLAANKGVCKPFLPAKRYIRSETVDAQMGEVETSRGNLFYPEWKQNLTILQSTPLHVVALPK